MPRMRLIEDLSLQPSNPLDELKALLEGHCFKRIAKATYLRYDEEKDEITVYYEDTPLMVFCRDGLVINFDEWVAPAAIARVNATLSLWNCYCEPRGGGDTEGGVYICEAGGRAMKYRPGFLFPYTVEDRAMDEDAELESVGV